MRQKGNGWKKGAAEFQHDICESNVVIQDRLAWHDVEGLKSSVHLSPSFAPDVAEVATKFVGSRLMNNGDLRNHL